MDKGFEVVFKFLTRLLGQRYAKALICLVLMSWGVSNNEIKERCGISWDTLRKYRTNLNAGNIETLFEKKGERQKSALTVYEDAILADFNAKPPKTLREAQERIKILTGITRSLNRLCVFLKKKGFELGL